MRGMGMSDDEVTAFLNDQRTLYLATVSPAGWPHVAPVGYARVDDDYLYVLTHPEQRKSKNVFHDNRVGVVIDGGETYTSYKGVFMHGYAQAVTDEDAWARLEAAWIDQFYGGKLPEVVRKVYAKRSGWIWFEIDPVHRVTWDNSNLDPERLSDVEPPDGSPFTYAVPDDLGAAAPEGPS